MITPDLKEDKDIKICIGKAWYLMLEFRQVFHRRDVNRRVKYNIYISGLLCGSGTWNLSVTNLKKNQLLSPLHHETDPINKVGDSERRQNHKRGSEKKIQ